MNILIVNDDGVNAPGLWSLAEALSEKADIYVCAPDTERSGQSQAITIVDNIYIHEVECPHAEMAFQTTGTPADCTKVGLQFYGEQGVDFDLVYSGINMGSNLGRDTLYSGTVGAAIEAAMSGVRAIAVSVDSHQASIFGPACKAALMVRDFSLEKLTPETIVNVNVPHIPEEEIKGVKVAKLAGRYYDDVFIKQEGGGFRMDGTPNFTRDPEGKLDSTCLSDGWITVTPLTFDYTDHSKIGLFEEQGFRL